MPQQPEQPQKSDAVLGGASATPTGALILGGLEGVRQRLKHPIAEQRAIALPQALHHGQRGVNLVIRALGDRAEAVRQVAYALLQERTEPKVIRALEQFQARTHYTRLQSLLATQKWQMADQETRAAMLRIYHLDVTAPLRSEQIEKFPCMHLRIMDQLWMQHSGGRFGFSVQRAIWQKYHDRYWDKAEVWKGFANRVGWRVDNLFMRNHWKRYNEITFKLNAPAGHLPFLGDQFGIFTIEAIVNRLGNCQTRSH